MSHEKNESGWTPKDRKTEVGSVMQKEMKRP